MNEVKKSAIIIDLDGTLCNTTHRQHHMQGKKDWKAFYAGIMKDPPHNWCVEIVNKFITTHHILLVSGRPGDYIQETLIWLNTVFKLSQKPEDPQMLLFMRQSGDFRKDSIIKMEIYEKFIQDHYDVLFCVDDRQQVVDVWRNLGLTCLQCAKGDF